MSNTTSGMYIKVLVVFLVILLIYSIYTQKCVEGFEGFTDTPYCGDCGKRGRYSCSGCVDCGYCISESGAGECIPGDSKGPFFRDDCVSWEYGSPAGQTFYDNRYPPYFMPQIYYH